MRVVTVDTSVVVAILTDEPGWRDLEKILVSSQPMISTASLVESFFVLRPWLGEKTSLLIDRTLDEYSFATIDFNRRHALIAQDALERYGKGRHPARLNFGDCIVYATAKLSDTPILFLGDDFKLTDLDLVTV